MTEVTERASLPWLTLSYSDAITNRGFKFVFQTSPTADWQAKQTVPTALKLATAATHKTPTTVGIIMDNTAAPVSFGTRTGAASGPRPRSQYAASSRPHANASPQSNRAMATTRTTRATVSFMRAAYLTVNL